MTDDEAIARGQHAQALLGDRLDEPVDGQFHVPAGDWLLHGPSAEGDGASQGVPLRADEARLPPEHAVQIRLDAPEAGAFEADETDDRASEAALRVDTP